MTSFERLAIVGPVTFWSIQNDDFSPNWNLEATLGSSDPSEGVLVEDSEGGIIRNPSDNPAEGMSIHLTLNEKGKLDRVVLTPA